MLKSSSAIISAHMRWAVCNGIEHARAILVMYQSYDQAKKIRVHLKKAYGNDDVQTQNKCDEEQLGARCMQLLVNPNMKADRSIEQKTKHVKLYASIGCMALH